MLRGGGEGLVMTGTNSEAATRGVMTAAISNSLVSLLHRYTGRGPTRARTTVDENLVVCVLGATLTKGEQSLVEAGKHEVVLQARRAFQEALKDEAIDAVQEISGRRVVAFMSSNHIDPDLAVEVFILDPIDSDSLEDQRDEGHRPDLDGDGRVNGRVKVR
jgi:uncharacterized protein YbcI